LAAAKMPKPNTFALVTYSAISINGDTGANEAQVIIKVNVWFTNIMNALVNPRYCPSKSVLTKHGGTMNWMNWFGINWKLF
jgi:hypothetical protein